MTHWLWKPRLAGAVVAVVLTLVDMGHGFAATPLPALPSYNGCNPTAPPFVPVPEAPDAQTSHWLPVDPAVRYGLTVPRPAGADVWRIMAFGDIMTSREVLWTAETYKAEGLAAKDAYLRPFQGIASLLADSDLTIANLEFPVRPDQPPQGCKPFNGEPAYLDALKELGVDLLFTANNHVLDQGVDGAATTLEEIRRRGFATIGTVTPGQPWNELLLLDIGTDRKLKLGFLNYTSGVADAGYKQNLEHLLFGRNVNYAFFNNDERLVKRIFGWFAGWFVPSTVIPSQHRFVERVHDVAATARADGAEYVIAFMSWGKALAFYPTSDQRQLAQHMCDVGVDAILGAGPHTIQPIEMLSRQGGGECLVAYSLGNLIGGVQGLANYGMALEVTLTRDDRHVVIQDVVPHVTFAVARAQSNSERPVTLELESRELSEFTSHLPNPTNAGSSIANTAAPVAKAPLE